MSQKEEGRKKHGKGKGESEGKVDGRLFFLLSFFFFLQTSDE